MLNNKNINDDGKITHIQLKSPSNPIDNTSKKFKTNKDTNKHYSKFKNEKENKQLINIKEKEPTFTKEIKTKRENFISKIPEYDGEAFIHLGKNTKRNFISKL